MVAELCGVHAGYGPGAPVLCGVDFALARGERVALRGPIGAGKSTLIYAIAGLLRPAAGEVRLFGMPCRSERDFAPLRPRLGIVFQDPDDQIVCPSVIEDVAFGPRNLGHPAAESRARAAEALAAVGLTGFEDRVPHRLSAGEKRLVALAGALAMRPEALLLDEPFAGLDPASVARVRAVLDALDVAMLIVSHVYEPLEGLAGRTLELRAGRLEPIGGAAQSPTA